MPDGIVNEGIGASVRRKEDKKLSQVKAAIQTILIVQASFMPILCALIAPMQKLPALINAIIHALEPLGVTDMSMPATPEKVWQSIQSAQFKAAE